MSKISEHLNTHQTFYLSITGLKIRSLLWVPLFWWHAIRSKTQADRSPGLLHSDVRKINGVQHTLTAWTSREAMKSYIYSGSHLKALKDFRKVATGKTFGFETNKLPSWSEVHQLYLEHGREY